MNEDSGEHAEAERTAPGRAGRVDLLGRMGRVYRVGRYLRHLPLCFLHGWPALRGDKQRFHQSSGALESVSSVEGTGTLIFEIGHGSLRAVKLKRSLMRTTSETERPENRDLL
jgi:hypothetical protein